MKLRIKCTLNGYDLPRVRYLSIGCALHVVAAQEMNGASRRRPNLETYFHHDCRDFYIVFVNGGMKSKLILWLLRTCILNFDYHFLKESFQEKTIGLTVKSQAIQYTWCCGRGALTDWAELRSSRRVWGAKQANIRTTIQLHIRLPSIEQPVNTTACGPKCHKFVSYIYSKLQESIK